MSTYIAPAHFLQSIQSVDRTGQIYFIRAVLNILNVKWKGTKAQIDVYDCVYPSRYVI